MAPGAYAAASGCFATSASTCATNVATCARAATCEQAAPASPRHGCAEPGKLGDGLWLVRVEHGVAVSVLPAVGAGQLTPRREG